MKQKLCIFEDHQANKDNNTNEKSIRINTSGHVDGIMYNPIVHLDIANFKKHNTISPMIKKEISHVEYKVMESQDILREGISIKHTINSEIENQMKRIEVMMDSQKNKLSVSKVVKIDNPTNKRLENFLDSSPMIIIMTIFTLFALFATDIQAASLPLTVDYPFDLILIFILVIFGLEIIIKSTITENYLWSFFFWLDLISTLSILQDVTLFFDILVSGYSSISPPLIYNNLTQHSNMTETGQLGSNAQDAASTILKISSASRATRVLRIIRIIRLIRIVKLYKNALLARVSIDKKRKEKERIKAFNEMMEKSSTEESSTPHSPVRTETNVLAPEQIEKPNPNNLKLDQELITLVRLKDSFPPINNLNIKRRQSRRLSGVLKLIDEQKQKINIKLKQKSGIKKRRNSKKLKKYLNSIPIEQIVNESKISKILSESITKRVIILIISMLLILPILSEDFFQMSSEQDISYNYLAKFFENQVLIYGENKLNFTTFNNESFYYRVLLNSVDSNFPIIVINLNGQRIFTNSSLQDKSFRNSETKTCLSKNGLVEIVYSNIIEIQLSGILNILRTFFVAICLALAAFYFEKDTQELVLDPLEIIIEIVDSVAKDPMNAKNVESLRRGVKQTMLKIANKKNGKVKEDSEENYELKVIESAIIKISAMLAIGFGEAGGEIIKENLSNGNELDAMLKGKKKTAIFGFCDIRNFSIINEALQERTMIFVNEIAEIVHSSADCFGGAANKNIGDAFLMVWKFKSENNPEDELNGKLRKIKDNLFETNPDSPLVQNICDMSVLGFLKVLIKINKDQRILAYRNDPDIMMRLNNYRVKMGFGLHLGWAIEGAIGSSYKIDASYLSPNVNMAARLEAATKIYGVNILISGSLYDYLSEDIQDICRMIDVVTVKGSVEPMRLYTIDLNLNITPQDSNKFLKIYNDKQKRLKYTKRKAKYMTESNLLGGPARFALSKNSFREILNTGRGREFYTTWKYGLDLYLKGTWEESSKYFRHCLTLVDFDGPCNTLLAFLKTNNFKAPDNWNGVRELTSKS